jgi:uncharacterized protein (TIGR02145 family)
VLGGLLVFPPLSNDVLAIVVNNPLKSNEAPMLSVKITDDKNIVNITGLKPHSAAKTDSLEITIITDNPNGYVVKLNTNSATETCLRRPSDGSSCNNAAKVINSASGAYGLATDTDNLSELGVNQWGASIANAFSPDPSADQVWFQVPNNTNPSTIQDSAAPTADTGETFTLTIGAKVDYTMPPTIANDEYQNEVIITTIADATTLPKPEITSITNHDSTPSENKGEITGGEAITIAGANLDYAYQVFIDLDKDGEQDNDEKCDYADIISDSQITCLTPSVTTAQIDTYDVVVKTWGGATKSAIDPSDPPSNTPSTNDDFIYRTPKPTLVSVSPADNTELPYNTTSTPVSVAVDSSGATCTITKEAGDGTISNNDTLTGLTNGSNTTLRYTCYAGTGDTQSQALTDTWTISVADAPPTAQNGDDMQTVTNATCPTTPVWVKDTRDNRTYYIGKIGTQCWMLTNIAYDIGSQYQLASMGCYVYTNWTNYMSWVNPGNTSVCFDSGTRICNSMPYTENTAPTGGGKECGYLYSWCGALLDSSLCNGNAGSVDYDRVGVCPAGWKVPTSGQASTLVNAAGFSSAWRFVLHGYFWPGDPGQPSYAYLDLQNNMASWWTATAQDLYAGYAGNSIIHYQGSFSVTWTSRGRGNAVRCVTSP